MALLALRRSRGLLLAGVAGALLVAAPAGQSHKLSKPLALSPGALGGDVAEVSFTPDGSRMIYLADQDVLGVHNLYSVPVDGSSPPVDLSGPGNHYVPVAQRQLSPDGAWLVYARDYVLTSVQVDGSGAAVELAPSAGTFRITPDGTGVCWIGAGPRLYRRPIDGSAPATLVAEVDCECSAGEIAISPDGEWAVHIGSFRLTPPPPYEFFTGLFSARLDGSGGFIPLVSLDEPHVRKFALTADSSRAVFFGEIADGFGGSVSALYSVPLDGSAAPLQLTDPNPDTSLSFELDPSGGRAVYEQNGIHSVPIDGSAAPIRLDGPFVPGGGLASDSPRFRITPDGARVVYRADQLVDQRFELFGVPIGGGSATPLSGAMPAFAGVFRYDVSPNSVGVVFTSDRATDEVVELFAASFGGGVVRLGPTLPAGGDVADLRITPDDTRVVFRADGVVNNVFELFSMPITGGASTKLSETPVPGGEVRYGGWHVGPDSAHVAYLADQETDEMLELFGAPIATAGAAVRLNAPLPPGLPSGDVSRQAVAPDSSCAVYVADGDVEDVFELYRVPVAGGPSVKLNAELDEGGDVLDLTFTPDGAHVIYRADQDLNNWIKLYKVPLDGSQAPVVLTHSGSVGWDYQLTPDGTRVVYLTSLAGSKLFSAPLDGAPAPVQLTQPGQNATLAAITPDGTRVAYRTFTDVYSIPTDGSGPAVKLNGRFGPGGIEVMLGRSLQISPDGTRVVYVADPRVDQRYELFSVPIGGPGSGRSARLNATFPPGGDVLQFEISPGGDRVVYYADQEVDGRYELFSVPIEPGHKYKSVGEALWDGVKLNGVLAANGIVGDGCCSAEAFAISPDGTCVAFSAQTTDSSHEGLFLASIDGSGTPLQLNAGYFSVGDLRFSPDGARILYRAFGTGTNGPGGIYSAFVDGSEAPVRLFASSSGGSYTLSPDGAWVVYRADTDQSGQYELFARPIDGSLDALQLNAPFQTNGDVGGTNGDWVTPSFLVTPDSRHVLYGADQEHDELFELFASPLPAARMRSGAER